MKVKGREVEQKISKWFARQEQLMLERFERMLMLARRDRPARLRETLRMTDQPLRREFRSVFRGL